MAAAIGPCRRRLSCSHVDGVLLMSRARLLMSAAFGAALLATAPVMAQSKFEEAKEKPVQLSMVPQAARVAAQKALGSKPTEAKVMEEKGQRIYELEAKNAKGKEKAVHVTADGKIVKREND